MRTFNFHASLGFEEYPPSLLELIVQCQGKALIAWAEKADS